MKNFLLTVILGLLISLSLTTTCEAQTQNLPIKIEETKIGNGNWDKVSVMLPNDSYKIHKVSYEDNKLFVVFTYTQKAERSKQRPVTFLLSDYKIDSKKISDDDTIFVVARHKDDVNQHRCPPNCPDAQRSRLADFKCPDDCFF